jgi:hypothetical protein
MPKGSTESVYQPRGNGRGVWVDVDKQEVRDWVGVVAQYAIIERQRRVARGDQSFPYAAPMELRVLFVFDRPRTTPEGPPIQNAGRGTKEGVKSAFGDLDKLVRAIPDALPDDKRYPLISTGPKGRGKQAKAKVIVDDRLITDLVAKKRFRDQVDMRPAGCYLTLLRASDDPVDLGLFV